MHRPPLARSTRRFGVLTATAAAVAVVTTAPAVAHTEVEAKGARALDQNVELTFSAESESSSAGIAKLEVILPKGIAPADVSYEEGPRGWKFAATDRGYTVSGPELAVGEDAEYAVTVRQLPDAKSLVFKTLQSYSDGKVDRWIELDDSGGDGHGHGHPAPRLELKPAAPGAELVGPAPSEEPSTAPSEEPSPATASPEPGLDAAEATAKPAADSAEGGDGVPVAVPLGIGAAVLALGGGLWWWRGRRGGAA